MEPLEGLLPHLSGHVVDVGKGLRGGPFARLDNGLYLRTILLPSEGALDTLQIQFYLFFNPDGTRANPPIGVLGDLLAFHLGYSVKFPGEFWGEHQVRAGLRRLKEVSGWRNLSVTLVRVKRPRPQLADAPRAWARLSVPVASWKRGELVGSDWTTLGRRVLNLVDEVVRLLELVRPKEGPIALQPH